MVQKIDNRQAVTRDFLDQLSKLSDYTASVAGGKGANSSELDNLLRAINSDLTIPVRMSSSDPADLVVTIGSAVITSPGTQRNRVISPIDTLVSSFTGGTITFPATNGNDVVPSSGVPTTILTNNSMFNKLGVFLGSGGALTLVEGTEGATAELAVAPPTTTVGIYIGYIVYEVDAGGNIQAIDDSDIYQFINPGSDMAALIGTGAIESAFCMTDGSGTANNCSDIVLDGSESLLTLDFSYNQNINPGQTQGDLVVKINGQIIPRFVAGSTVDSYYTEEPGMDTQIRFWTDISGATPAASIEVTRTAGTIDNSDSNRVGLQSMMQSAIITADYDLDNLLNYDRYVRLLVDTSGGAVTIDLPSVPIPGARVVIKDVGGVFAANNVTVDPGVRNIHGVNAVDTLSTSNSWIEYEYYNHTRGWIRSS